MVGNRIREKDTHAVTTLMLSRHSCCHDTHATMNLKEREKLSKLIREDRGTLSQRAYAKRVGINYASIRNWENCVNSPHTEGLEKLAKVMGYSFSEFMQIIESDGDNPEDIPVEKIERYIKNLDRKSFLRIARTVFAIMASIAGETSDIDSLQESNHLVESK